MWILRCFALRRGILLQCSVLRLVVVLAVHLRCNSSNFNLKTSVNLAIFRAQPQRCSSG